MLLSKLDNLPNGVTTLVIHYFLYNSTIKSLIASTISALTLMRFRHLAHALWYPPGIRDFEGTEADKRPR